MQRISKHLTFGPLLIMIAASLWAIDALFRTQLTYEIPAAAIVFIEHTIGFIFLAPFLYKSREKLSSLTQADWIKLLFLTVVSSVLGTLLFTEALSRSALAFDFLTPILIQKLQPLFVIIFSSFFLKEKLSARFIGLSIIALIGSYLISFGPDGINFEFTEKEQVVALAMGAALAWGLGTILSKSVLEKISFKEATALRFLLAIPVAFVATYVFNQTYDYTQLNFDQIWRFILISSTTGGAVAIMLYYNGLKKTEAKVATFAELSFPIVSTLIAITALNPYGEAQKLLLTNTFGIIILIISILIISIDYTSDNNSKN